MPTTHQNNMLTINRILASGRYLLIGVEEDEEKNLKSVLVPVGVTPNQIETAVLSQADRLMLEMEKAETGAPA